MPDLIDQMFGSSVTESGEEDEHYPGSKRKRREKPGGTGEPQSWRDNYTTKIVGGEPKQFYPIGALAEALGTSVVSVRRWTAAGRLPQAPFRNRKKPKEGTPEGGYRLYTEELIDAAVESFARRGLLHASRIEWKQHKDLSVEIHQKWQNIHNQQTGTK